MRNLSPRLVEAFKQGLSEQGVDTSKEAESPLDFPEQMLDQLEGFAGGYIEPGGK